MLGDRMPATAARRLRAGRRGPRPTRRAALRRFDLPPGRGYAHARSPAERRKRASVASKKAYKGFTTKAVHVGQDPDPSTGAVIPPIHMTSTYIQEEFGVPGKYVYSRSGNPTRRNLETSLAVTGECRARGGVRFGHRRGRCLLAVSRPRRPRASALRRCTAVPTACSNRSCAAPAGCRSTYVDTSDLDATEAAWTEQTRMLYIETPTNPLMQLTDIAAAAELAQRHGALLVVDNTFMSPYLQTPARFRRPPGAAFHHQVPQRPLRQHRRRRMHQPRRPRHQPRLRRQGCRERRCRRSKPGSSSAA